jgi:hypothetical protein
MDTSLPVPQPSSGPDILCPDAAGKNRYYCRCLLSRCQVSPGNRQRYHAGSEKKIYLNVCDPAIIAPGRGEEVSVFTTPVIRWKT